MPLAARNFTQSKMYAPACAASAEQSSRVIASKTSRSKSSASSKISGQKQTIILARLSGGPLAQTGVLQGMSGSPVYIDGKLLGAVALGFPFSKEPIAGIQPIEAMLAGATFPAAVDAHAVASALPLAAGALGISSPFGNLSDIPTPLAVSGFSSTSLSALSPRFRNLGLQLQEGVALTAQNSPGGVRPNPAVAIVPGSMISVGLITGDMNVTADGTVTYVSGKRIYAFGHRFLDAGLVELPFAHSEVIASIPTLNSSFKLSAPGEWVGTILSDRSTAVAGEISRPSTPCLLASLCIRPAPAITTTT